MSAGPKKFKILVTHSEVAQEAIDLMAKCAEIIRVTSMPPTREEIIEKVKGVDGIFWCSIVPCTKEIIEAAGPQLKSIAVISAGFDYVDVEELKKRKIPLGHTPVVPNNAVADTAMGLMLAAARRFHEGRLKIAGNAWDNYRITWMCGQDVQDATVGFYGFGNIGQFIAKRLKGFDIKRILYTNRHQISEETKKEFNATEVEFDELLAESDIIFIAAPLTPDTTGIFNSSAFSKMKKTAVLVNIGRGAIINQDDLYTALKTREIFAAGLDVMYPEPLPADDKLLTLPNLELPKMSKTQVQSKLSSGDGKNPNAFKVLVTHPEVPQEALDLLAQSTEVIMCQSLPPTPKEILQKVQGVHGIFWGSLVPCTKEVLEAAGPQLKSIAVMSAGIDYVDVNELKKRKIPLGHTPIALNDAVADIAMGLMLAAARRFHEGRRKIESSTWENFHLQWMLGQDIRDSTVGFFGFGGIAQCIAERLKGFNIQRILYNTRRRIAEDMEKKFNASKVEFQELLTQSDILFIAAPLTPETEGIFNANAFSKMKKTAVLINIARGTIINQDDLYTALITNQIFAAGLDVMSPEPLTSNDKLLTLPNVVSRLANGNK